MKKSYILVIISIFFISVITVFPIKICNATGNELHVGSGQTYTTIQDAISAANADDIIYVHSGSYNGPITIGSDLTSLTLSGAGSGSTTITTSSDQTVKVQANGVTINGFKIQNSGSSSSYSSILLDSVSGCTIKNNILTNSANGVYLLSANSNTIKDNNIEINNVGLYFSNSDSNTIQSNIIQNNGNGARLSSAISNSNIFYLNTFTDNFDNNAWDPDSNSWSYNSQGNYWDDYTGEDANDDDIGDTPYNIPGGGGSQDQYPLGYFIEENQQPVAFIQSISPNPATEGQTIYFNGYGSDDGTILAWEWKVDGVVKSTSEDFSSSDFSVGSHTATFRVQDDNSEWSSTVSDTFTVISAGQPNNAPTATIFYPQLLTTANYGDSVRFYGIGEDSDQGDTVSYSWTSDKDGFLSGEDAFYKSDLTVNTHLITLKVTDNHGAYSEATVSIEIIADPTVENHLPIAVSGGPYTGTVDSPVSFDGSNSYDPDEGDSIIGYNWDFGDGAKGSGMTVSHTYSAAGDYTVQLTVTDSNGEQNTDSKNVNITAQQANGGSNGSDENGDNKNDKWVIPGFEIIILIFAIISIIVLKKRKND